MKYFILGAISSGFLLYGASLIYGYAGSTQFSLIGQSLIADGEVPLGLVIGMVFLLAGLAFKISAVPFHMWTPDVYHGAPMAVTALFSMVPKLAALALLIRVVHGPFAPIWFDAQQIIWFMAVASMFVGAIGALLQGNLKRLLAYSAIANIGYALIGVVAGGSDGISGVFVYVAVYTIMPAGVFACIVPLRRGGIAVQDVDDLTGLVKDHPFITYTLAALMFSLSGIPPMAGFVGKLVIFETAVDAGMMWLAVLGVLSSVIAAAYYLRVIKVMIFDKTELDGAEFTGGMLHKLVIGFSIGFILFMILNPQPLLDWANTAGQTLFG